MHINMLLGHTSFTVIYVKTKNMEVFMKHTIERLIREYEATKNKNLLKQVEILLKGGRK
jgi:phage portal protein BeeE